MVCGGGHSGREVLVVHNHLPPTSCAMGGSPSSTCVALGSCWAQGAGFHSQTPTSCALCAVLPHTAVCCPSPYGQSTCLEWGGGGSRCRADSPRLPALRVCALRLCGASIPFLNVRGIWGHAAHKVLVFTANPPPPVPCVLWRAVPVVHNHTPSPPLVPWAASIPFPIRPINMCGTGGGGGHAVAPTPHVSQH